MKRIETVRVVGIGIGEPLAPDGTPAVLRLTCDSKTGHMTMVVDVEAATAPAIGDLLRVTAEWGEGE